MVRGEEAEVGDEVGENQMKGRRCADGEKGDEREREREKTTD